MIPWSERGRSDCLRARYLISAPEMLFGLHSPPRRRSRFSLCCFLVRSNFGIDEGAWHLTPSNLVVDFDLTSIDVLLLMLDVHSLGNTIKILRQKMQPKWDTKGRERQRAFGGLCQCRRNRRDRNTRKEGRGRISLSEWTKRSLVWVNFGNRNEQRQTPPLPSPLSGRLHVWNLNNIILFEQH